ncbi:MAG: hypothetical protein WC365_03705 [Candidatus Babeliales bacterium]|jgi:hypothetical protein
MERTTDLTKLEHGNPFTWGILVKIHSFFDYTIVEYHPHVYKDGHDTGKIDTVCHYHIYIDGKDCSRSYEDFDSAIAGCLAYKYDGCNTRADIHFMKMIK